ncbi:triple tyrosine motif-containing protein [Flavobacterium psychrotrophum]|uniref:triple tyrosine motif-containing protein n=1 Tax=Flavobacterium psychrotrophum TaxID=2294119 RepID=UPI000E3234F4|nr:triple tyrosine motif-containing protein [Flavobacterium psychrotrophum]
MKKNILTLLLLIASTYLWAQVLPSIKLYTRQDFKADSQFWAATESADGTLFFGNNDGILIYDGERWQRIVLPNSSSVRSLANGKDGTVYVGAYDEAGILSKNKQGNYVYRSLIKELQTDGKNIENIWDIQSFNGRMLYRANSEIIITSGKTATHLPSASMFSYSAVAGNNYYVEEMGHGILTLQPVSNTLIMAFSSESYNNEEVAEILPGENPGTLLIVTLQGGLYRGELSTGKVQLLNRFFDATHSGRANCALKNSDGSIYIGTAESGIISISRTGVVDYNVPGFTGLQNGVVQSLYRASDGNFWALQDNGLAYADYHSPYRVLFGKASVYDALPLGDSLYIATTQGVYFTDDIKTIPQFKKVSGLQGQAWAIQKAQDDIIASGDAGLFVLKNGEAKRISATQGFWKITSIKSKPGFYLASQYNGLYLLENAGNEWVLHDKIAGFNESARDILPADEPDTYWICHGYQGVFRVRINAVYNRVSAVDHFTNKNGLPDSFNVNVFRWQGKVVFTTNTGIYTYNETHNRFVPFERLNKILNPSKNTRKIIEHGGRTWFVQDDEAGYFVTADKNAVVNTGLFLNLKSTFNRGMECIAGLPDNRMLFGTTNGLFLYNISNPVSAKGIHTQITQISYTQTQKQDFAAITYKGDDPVQLPNRMDILRFDFAAPKMTHGTQVEYSYMLENTDADWSPWQDQPFKEYTHLRPGTYTFKVKSRNTAGLMGTEAKYIFTVLPRWYQTTAAYILYVLGAAGFVYSVRLLIKRRIRYERAKSTRDAERTRRMLELEVEQLKLQRDKEAVIRDKAVLEEDVINKSKELANYTMLLMQKKDAFAEITDDLKELRDYLRNEESRKKLLEIFQKLNRHKVGEEYMEVFDVHFEKVHHNFFEALKTLSPSLTQRELRLCAFVKMGLTNKEIAPLLNISLRGVENARYRIRKKLNVANEDNFPAFLEGIGREIEM